jgi:hypothetical protein
MWRGYNVPAKPQLFGLTFFDLVGMTETNDEVTLFDIRDAFFRSDHGGKEWGARVVITS